jgi:cation transport ATPase
VPRDMAPDLSGWTAFFAAQLAASATLAGLSFVALSLNLSKILANRSLPDRALAGFCMLLANLLVSSLLLLPGQSLTILGAETLAVWLLLWCVVTPLDLGALRRSESEHRRHFVFHLLLFQAAVVPYLVGGVILLNQSAAGLYWAAAAVILSLVATFFEAWVLLVEINR